MKEFVEATREANIYHIGSLHKAIGGQICRKKLRTVQRSVTSTSGLPQIFTDQEEFLILYPVLGLSLSGA